MSLVARKFEEAGLPTLILGSALDILQAGRAPRVKFLNYPLGFSSGSFQNPDNQYEVVRAALAGFDQMRKPGLEHLEFQWDEGWEMIRARERSQAETDTRSKRDLTPRYQTDADRLLVEQNIST